CNLRSRPKTRQYGLTEGFEAIVSSKLAMLSGLQARRAGGPAPTHRLMRVPPPTVLLENGTEEAKSECGRRAPDHVGWARRHLSQASKRTTSVLVPVGRRDQESRRLTLLDRSGPDLHIAGMDGHDLDGEFDPGSGRTLAACLTHASRTSSNQWQHWRRASGE